MTTVAQNDIAHVADPEPVHHDHARLHAPGDLPLFLRELEDLTVLADEDIFLRHTELARELRVLYEMMVLAVHGHEEFRTYEVVHQLELFAAAVPRYMDALIAPVDHVRAELHEVVDCL